jgi:hypothetical protein
MPIILNGKKLKRKTTENNLKKRNGNHILAKNLLIIKFE